MKLSIKMVICLLSLIIGSGPTCIADEWHGIVPLHSTRDDVIKLLGPPRHVQWDYRDYFEVENGIVTLEWIDPGCLRKYPVEPAKTIQLDDLVLNISVRLIEPVVASTLRLPEDSFYFMDCIGSGAGRSCIFMRDGFSYATSREGVTSLSYGPTQKSFKEWKENHRGCISSRN